MQNHLMSRDYRLPKEFEVAGKFYVPTTGYLTINLIDQTGSVLYSDDLPANNPSAWVIAGDIFTLDATERFKQVFLDVQFQSENSTHIYSESFRVIRFKPITVTPSRVVAELGDTGNEIDLSLIDVYQAYVDLSDKIGADLFADSRKSPEANKAIFAQLVLTLLPTLQFKLKALVAIDDHKIQRLQLDFDALRDHYSVQLNRVLIDHFGYEDRTAYEPLITFATRGDIITGE